MIAGRAARLRIIGGTLLFVAFIAGGLAGAAFYQAVVDDPEAQETPARERDPARDNDNNRRRSSIYDRLSLTPEQDSAVDAIFARQAREANRIWNRSYRPVMDSLVSEARSSVRDLLTPEQTQHLDSLLTARRNRRNESSSRSDAQRDGEGAGGRPRPRHP